MQRVCKAFEWFSPEVLRRLASRTCFLAWYHQCFHGDAGGEYLKAITEVKCDAGESIPYLAIACMKAQKLSTRVEDGVCKSIPCSKIQAFSHKNMKKEVHLAERHLRVAREIVEKLGLRDKALVPLGHLDVRVVLHLTGQKKLYEDREYPDLDAISQVMAPQIKLQ